MEIWRVISPGSCSILAQKRRPATAFDRRARRRIDGASRFQPVCGQRQAFRRCRFGIDLIGDVTIMFGECDRQPLGVTNRKARGASDTGIKAGVAAFNNPRRRFLSPHCFSFWE